MARVNLTPVFSSFLCLTLCSSLLSYRLFVKSVNAAVALWQS